MNTIVLDGLQIDFGDILHSVPSDGSSWDWICEDWTVVEKAVEVSQKNGSTMISGVTFYDDCKTENEVYFLRPKIYELDELKAFCVNAVKERPGLHIESSAQVLKKGVSCIEFSWGYLVRIHWTEYGYAPGGAESFLLPTSCPAIHFGFLNFDWTDFKFTCVSEKRIRD